MTRSVTPGDGFAPLDMESVGILAALVKEPFPGRDEIALQVAVARSRRIDDDDGCLALSAREAPRATVLRRVPIEAEADDLDGMTIHVLLHVVDGYIDELELYREDGQALLAPVRTETLRIVAY